MSEHVDFLGCAWSVTHRRGSSRYSLGLVMQGGRGKVQYVETGNKDPQKVLVQAYGFSLAMTHGF